MTHRVLRFSLVGVAVAMALACGSSDNPGGDTPTTPEAGGGDDGGTPPVTDDSGPAPADAGPDSAAPVSGTIAISEIMYHPVSENAAVDNHEYVEIYNRAATPIDLTGWKITGGITYTFPAGAKIEPGAYKVIAKNPAMLADVPQYGLKEADLFGPYANELDNGGATITLLDADSKTVELVKYNDAFPWAVGADALGADDEWLALLPTPTSSVGKQYRGRSLERVAFDITSSDVSNWIASPLEGPSPGKANSVTGKPPTIVTEKAVTKVGADPLIRATDSVTISVAFSALGTLATPKLEYFVDDVQTTGEATTTVDMTLKAAKYEVTLPPKPDNSIVRYRIKANIGGAAIETISPRSTDPYAWWGYFVNPVVTVGTPAAPTEEPIYNVFIKKSNWDLMYDNVHATGADTHRVVNDAAGEGCLVRPSWDAQVPIVFTYNGVVYDSFGRYQGSRWNRESVIARGVSNPPINPTPSAGKFDTSVGGWKIDFPGYARFEPATVGGSRRGKIILNKLKQACPGLDDTLGQRIYGDPAIGIPVQSVKFARIHVNGGYYHYMMDLEHIDGDMMKRYLGVGEPMGDLFKADGNSSTGTVEGPWSITDERTIPLSPTCTTWTVDQRYEYSYQRYTNKWDTVATIRGMIEELNTLRTAAMTSGNWAPVQAYFKAKWDYNRLRDYIVIRNWAQPWDDGFHNHHLYRRATDGKWLMIPQDKDMEWGEQAGYASKGTQASFLSTQFNTVKDTFIKAFTAEVWARVIELDGTVLSPANFRAQVDAAFATYSVVDGLASPASSACVPTTEPTNIKIWAGCRHQDVQYLETTPAGTAPLCNLTNPSPF